MRVQTAAAAISMALVGRVAAQDAAAVTDNPAGVAYKATLPEERFFKDAELDGNVKGYISAVAPEDGNGVKFQVKFENLPKEGGPFTYHIHVEPSSNCTATLAHLDPFERGEEPACDSDAPETCQVGDLSGKHGKINSDPFEAEYIDYYASTKEGLGAFFGNRSFVLHYANKTRLTCADFEQAYDVPVGNSTTPFPTPGPSKTAVGTGGLVPTPTGSPEADQPPFTDSASAKMLSVPLLAAGLIAAAFAL